MFTGQPIADMLLWILLLGFAVAAGSAFLGK